MLRALSGFLILKQFKHRYSWRIWNTVTLLEVTTRQEKTRKEAAAEGKLSVASGSFYDGCFSNCAECTTCLQHSTGARFTDIKWIKSWMNFGTHVLELESKALARWSDISTALYLPYTNGQRMSVVSLTSRFANVLRLFAHVFSRFANVVKSFR